MARQKVAGANEFLVRPGRPDDLSLLPELESRADQSFAIYSRFLPMLEMDGLTPEKCQNLPASTKIWIADTDRPVGFACTWDIDDLSYLAQISVVPENQGSGIGGALLKTAMKHSRDEGKPAIVLTAYQDVPWNAPFYARHGFEVLFSTNMGPELLKLAKRDEKEWGCFSPRVVMGHFF